MKNEGAATTSNVTSFPELKGDLVDRLDEVAERLGRHSTKKEMKKRFFGLLSAA